LTVKLQHLTKYSQRSDGYKIKFELILVQSFNDWVKVKTQFVDILFYENPFLLTPLFTNIDQ
jgi:hypothetical protein